MKKAIFVFLTLLFFLCQTNVFVFQKPIAKATFQNNSNIQFVLKLNNRVFKFLSSEVLENVQLSQKQKEMISKNERLKVLKQLENFGLTKKERLCYVFPELEEMLKKVSKTVEIYPEKDLVYVVLNKCEIEFEEGSAGVFLDLEKFYNDVFDCAKKQSDVIEINLQTKTYKNTQNLKNEFLEKSCFSTSFKTSSKERKNNIRTALEKFDGFVLEEGEILSFNSVTGKRDESSGYSKSKIIMDGTFVDGFGGGVCQVSTTIYNACLLAGLEVLEVHQHSLPVSYVEPSFDAMVNSGSSDLIIRNNSGGKLIFTTSHENDECKVKIFGKKNKFKITRISEKTKTIPPEKDVVETDLKKFNAEDLLFGEERRISYAKEGYHSNGFLNFYDEKGVLVETKKIRENKYNPVKGVVVKNTL